MNDAGFVRETEVYRRELLAHCYRMLGSVADAEDLVQETYLRAWRAYGGFEGRSSVRSWLYRIATNACLSALDHRSRRVLPSGLGAPAEDTSAPDELAPEVTWLQPLPDPADVVSSREDTRLALVAGLQYLPPRQRAVLLLRDVLAFSAAEVAEVLGMTVAAVKSALQRARATMGEVVPEDVVEPAEPEARALLERYIHAFEHSDAAALEEVLRADAMLEATPSRTWYSGKATCLPVLVERVFGPWRMFPVRANGQPAAVSYLRGEDGRWREWGVVVLGMAEDGIHRISAFGDPSLVPRFL